MTGTTLLTLCLLVSPVFGYYKLTPLSYLKLPSDRLAYKLFGDTAVAAAYDPVFHKMYIVGSTPHMLHVVDVTFPDKPVRLFAHMFTPGEGEPRDVAVCGNEVAVALSATPSNLEGHVRLFKTYDGTESDLVLNGYVAVGMYPNRLQYTKACDVLIVANMGVSGKEHTTNKYYDPEGTISIIRDERNGYPSVQTLGFTSFNSRTDIRTPARFIPRNLLSTDTLVSQDLQPTSVAITYDGRSAFITLQDNDAVAKLDIAAGTITSISPLSRKDWGAGLIDPSDRDGGVHRRSYPHLKGMRQPSEIVTAKVNRKDFVFTADEGSSRTYTSAKHGFVWTDASVASSLANSIDETATSAEFKTNVSTDEFLGRLYVSKFDGYKTDFGYNKYVELNTFGGRGFSVWDSSSYTSPVFDSGDTIEEYTEAFDKKVFNTDCLYNTATYQSPENLRDTTSDFKGPQINTIDMMTDNGTTLLVVGSKTSGTLFLYTVNITGSVPQLSFQSIFRAGKTDFPWDDLYQMDEAGDLYISRVGLIPSTQSPNDKPMLYVVGNGSGSLSMYQIETDTGSITGGPMVR